MMHIRLSRSEKVADTGSVVNSTNPASPYSHGLAGVNMPVNWVCINILVGCFMVLLCLTFVYRFTELSYAQLRRLFTIHSTTDQSFWTQNHSRIWTQLKKHLISAPIGRVRHNREVQLSSAVSFGTLPSRFHAVLLALYFASNVAYCLALDWDAVNMAATIASLRGRSGALASANLIPTMLFAMRNNPFISLLRIPYDTFNLLHRWCARIVIIEAIVHVSCWLANGITAGGYLQLKVYLTTSASYRSGLVGALAFLIIGLMSFGPVRHAFYETFLNTHRALVVAALVGVYVHLDKALLPQLPYIQLCIALWSAEWCFRLGCILYYNTTRRKRMATVTVCALPGEACRITLQTPRGLKWQPGCHIHLYLPTISLWTSHPFSIAWADTSAPCPSKRLSISRTPRSDLSQEDVETATLNSTSPPTDPRDSISMYSRPEDSSEKTTPSSLEAQKTTAQALGQQPEVATSSNSLSLIVRARTGMTRQLYGKATSTESKTFNTTGLVEGPYGAHIPVNSYGTVVLFAGGVGITHCIGMAREMIRESESGTSSVRKIRLVWSIPSTELYTWVRDWIDKIIAVDSRGIFSIDVYVTRAIAISDVPRYDGVLRWTSGRCNPSSVLKEEMENRVGSMFVTVCGPGAFADDVRAASRAYMVKGALDFVEEAFTY